MRSRLVEVLQTRRYEYKGQWYPLSSSGIEQVVRELSAVSLTEGLLPANERLYGKLALGITLVGWIITCCHGVTVGWIITCCHGVTADCCTTVTRIGTTTTTINRKRITGA